ncbi:MAG TPA: RNA methyltransferase [Acidimicrobiales bacterium]|nr:RNA methyltransferase [Acidimicrobiales bacterium]
MRDQPVITSPANPLFRRLRLLATSSRRKGSSFFFEGVQPVWRAVEAKAPVELVVVAPELVQGTPAERLVEEAEAAGIASAYLSGELFARLSGRDGPSGVAAVCDGHVASLEDLVPGSDDVVLVLHEVANPGNLGSIVRTADAGGAAAVVLSGRTADPFSTTAVKASMGSIFSVPVVRAATAEEVFHWAGRHGVRTLTTSAHASTSYLDTSSARPVAVVFGSEGEGLGAALLGLGDEQIRIPMVGSASSLNLSVSVGIVLFALQAERLARAPVR